jgi:hypothetical protein
MRVYRFLYREGRPVGVHEVQKGLKLSSPSVAHYHLRKLVEEGLVKENSGGYIVDKVLFENMIRVRRSIIPLQTALFAIFFGTLIVSLIFFLPQTLSLGYVFSLGVNALAAGIFGFQSLRSVRRKE